MVKLPPDFTWESEEKHEVVRHKRVPRARRGVVKKQWQARVTYCAARATLHTQLSTVFHRYPMGDVPFSTDPPYAHLDWIEGPILRMEKRWRECGEKAETGLFWSVWATHPNKIILHKQTTNEEAARVARGINEAFLAWKAWATVEPDPPMCSEEPFRYDFEAPSRTRTQWVRNRKRRRRQWGITVAFAALFTVGYPVLIPVLTPLVAPSLHTLAPVIAPPLIAFVHLVQEAVTRVITGLQSLVVVPATKAGGGRALGWWVNE